MELTIKNVAAIKNATILCDGLTVVTGKNGSGKSTIGKTISSLFNSLRLAPKEYESYKMLQDKINLIRSLGMESYSGNHYTFGAELRNALPFTYKYVNGITRTKYYEQNYDYIERILLEIRENMNAYRRLLSYHREKLSFESFDFDTLYRRVNEYKHLLNTRIDDYDYGLYLSSYVKKALDSAFVGQVKPIFDKQANTSIEFSDSNLILSFDYDETSLHTSYNASDYRVYYIDNPRIIEDISETSFSRKTKWRMELNTKIILDDLINFRHHRNEAKLIDDYKGIFDLINLVYPYQFVESYSFSTTTNNGIDIKNEANGRKIFALIKEMLLRNLITDKTILVFDEPENHLHPKWQALFAKLAFAISETLGTKIICITHSPTMLLAFDVYSKNKNRKTKLSAYYLDANSDKQVLDVSDDIAKAHREMSDPYIHLDLFGDSAI